MRSQHPRSPLAARLALLTLLLVPAAASAANRLRIAASTVEIGQTGRSVAVLADCDTAFGSAGIAVDYDTSEIRVTGITPGADVPGTPDFFGGSFDGGRVHFAFVLDYEGAVSIPAGSNRHVMTISFDVLAGFETTSTFAFRNDGAASEYNEIVDTDGDIVPGLSTTNGLVSIVEAGTGPEIVDPPSCLIAVSASSDTIVIEWDDNSDNETGFEVERLAARDDVYARVATLPANSTRYEDGSVGNDTGFSYRVRAVGAESASEFTPSVWESPKRLGVVKAKGKLGKKGWKLALSRMTFDPGAQAYDGEGDEIRVRLGGVDFFTSGVAVKAKRDKRSGDVVKVTLKDSSKNKLTLDFAKKSLKAKLLVADASSIDLSSGTVLLEVEFSRFVAEIDLPVEIQGPKENKAVFAPVAGGAFLALPELNPCN